MTEIAYFYLLHHQMALEHGPSLQILIGTSRKIFSGESKRGLLLIKMIFLPDRMAPPQILIQS
jgi:hypothetical protein